MNATFTGDVIFSDNKYSETTIAGPQKNIFLRYITTFITNAWHIYSFLF